MTTGLSEAERDQQIVNLRANGLTYAAIAEQVDLSERHVKRVVLDAAQAVRDRTQDAVEERFMTHLHRLQELYRLAREWVLSCRTVKDFGIALRSAMIVLEREARMLGLDRQNPGPGESTVEWMIGASDETLAQRAKLYGLKLPEKFSAPTST